MELKFFSDCHTLAEAKAKYRRLAKEYHPQNNKGDDEVFKLIGLEYNMTFKHLNHGWHQDPEHSFQLFGMTWYTFKPLKGRHIMNAISLSLRSAEDALLYMIASTLTINGNVVTSQQVKEMPLYILSIISQHFFTYNNLK